MEHGKIVILRRRKLGITSCKEIKKFSKYKDSIQVIRNDKKIPTDTDLLIRWGTTSQFPSKRTLNKAESIRNIGNKYKSRLMLQEAGVSVPTLYENLDEIVYPVIAREHYHSQGKKLFLCNNRQELNKALDELNTYYISEYIPKEKEFGVFIFDNRVTCVIEKVKKNEEDDGVAWNVSQGNYAFEYLNWSDWSIKICKEALRAAKPFNIDFCRVDIMVKDGIPYVLELNSAHSLTSEYRQEVFAKALDYYIENGKVKNELDLEEPMSYKTLIHPALRLNKLGKNV